MLNKWLSRGATVVELAVVVAILAVVLAMATPSFTTLIANQHIRSAADSVKSGLQFARIEALRRNSAVVFDMSALDSSWSVGCVTPDPDDNDGDGLSDCPAVIRTETAPFANASAALTMASAASAVRATFTSLGLVRSQNSDGSAPVTQVDITAPNVPLSSQTPLRVLLPTGGLVRVCDPAVTTTGDSRKC